MGISWAYLEQKAGKKNNMVVIPQYQAMWLGIKQAGAWLCSRAHTGTVVECVHSGTDTLFARLVFSVTGKGVWDEYRMIRSVGSFLKSPSPALA